VNFKLALSPGIEGQWSGKAIFRAASAENFYHPIAIAEIW
jgi:hypothetical protein